MQADEMVAAQRQQKHLDEKRLSAEEIVGERHRAILRKREEETLRMQTRAVTRIANWYRSVAIRLRWFTILALLKSQAEEARLRAASRIAGCYRAITIRRKWFMILKLLKLRK